MNKKIITTTTMLAMLTLSLGVITTPAAHAQNTIMLGGSFNAMNEETLQYVKDYLTSVIQNNLTASTSVIVNGDPAGTMSLMEQGESQTDSADDIFMIIGAGFSTENGYRFEEGKLIAPNGTQILPKE
jgi:hypothetical protein